MGPYCMYCDHRCFVLREVPGASRQVLMATCRAGRDHDQIRTGYTAHTTINPYPAATQQPRADQPA